MLFSAGTYTLTGSIYANKGIVLRGAGPTQTTINLSGSATIAIGMNTTGGLGSTIPANAFTVHNWTGGLTQGSTVLTLDSTTGISAGQDIDIDELNPAWVFVTGVAGACTSGNSCGRNSNGKQFYGDDTRAAPQIVHVVSVNSSTNQITIAAPGVGFNHSSSLTPQTFSWVCNGCIGGNPNTFGGNVQYGGVENLTVNANQIDYAISLAYCDYCWVKNVAIHNIARAAVFFWWGLGDMVRDSYIDSNQTGAPTQYGIEVMSSSQALIENNICYNVTACLLPESDYGMVAGYNYAVNTVPGNLFASYTTHLAHNYMSLWEGDVVDTLTFDNSWGSASHSTIFRSRPDGTGVNKTNYKVAVKLDAQQHYMNVIASVLGDPTFHTQYQCDNITTSNADNFVYDLGNWDSCENGSSQYDAVTESSMMRWGDWDAVTYCANGGHAGTTCGSTGSNGVRYCTGAGAGNTACTASETANADPTFPGLSSPSTTFPASFYQSSEPSWFTTPWGTPPWPPIGPDVTGGNIANTGGHANQIPAQLCYFNTAKDANGFLTAFDANACYSNSISTAPAAPAGLTATVQ